MAQWSAAAPVTTISQSLCLVQSTGTATGSPSGVRVVESTFEIANPAVTFPQAMMVYTGGSTTMYSRAWDPLTGGWGAQVAAPVVAATVQHLALALSRTRNEATVGLLDTAGDIYALTWNGTSWIIQHGGVRLSNIGTGAPNAAFSRGVDVVYQTNSDIATIVYDNGANAVPEWASWDGTTFNFRTGVAAKYTTAIGTGGGTNIPWWIELAANPATTSSEVALIALQGKFNATNSIAVRANVFAGGSEGGVNVWPAGAAAINGGASFGTATDTNVRKGVAVAYETVSGRAMYAWADSATAGRVNYTVYTGTVQNVAPTTLALGSSTPGIGQWLRLASAPRSNNIMVTMQDANKHLDTALWSGSAFGAATNHSTATQTTTEKNFEFAFEAHPSSPGWGWLVWGNGTGISRRQFQAGTTWSSTFSVTPAQGSPTINFVDLNVNPVSGRLLDIVYSTSTSVAAGIWTSARQGAIRDPANKFTPLGWYAPPTSGVLTNGLVIGTTSAASPSGERVAVSVRPSGAALIEMQEVFP